jgi:predicted nucleic acid-binding protein
VIVLDASAVIEFLLNSTAGHLVASRIATARGLHAPHLLDLEVTNVYRRYTAAGYLAAERAALALTALSQLPLRRHGHAFLLERVWALRGVLTAYDAAYVALAEVLGAPLVTLDARLARAGGHGAKIEVIAS